MTCGLITVFLSCVAVAGPTLQVPATIRAPAGWTAPVADGGERRPSVLPDAAAARGRVVVLRDHRSPVGARDRPASGEAVDRTGAGAVAPAPSRRLGWSLAPANDNVPTVPRALLALVALAAGTGLLFCMAWLARRRGGRPGEQRRSVWKRVGRMWGRLHREPRSAGARDRRGADRSTGTDRRRP